MRERYNNIDNPAVLEQSSERPYVAYDIYSKLLKDRIIFIGEEIDDDTANVVIGEMLYLDTVSKDPIRLYINSGGGVVTSGLAIYDTMHLIKSPVYTVCVGQAASMAAVLLAAGEKGHRCILPHSRVMIHQPSGGAMGPCADIQIAAKEIERIRKELNGLLAECTGKSIKSIEKDCDRDIWMNAEDAVKYGLVDKIII